MKGIEFEEMNVILGESQPQYGTLPAHYDSRRKAFVACFQLTDAEIVELLSTKKLWYIQSGTDFAPMRIAIDKEEVL